MSSLVRQMQARRSAQRAGALTIVGLVGLLVFAVTARNGVPDYVPGVNRTSVSAEFKDVGALRAGDDVRIADVRVGYVRAVDLVNGAPVVDMKLDGERSIYGDATAVIRSRSGLGQKYVDIDPGTSKSGELDAGQPIGTRHTEDATDLDSALSAFDPKTREGTQTTLRQVGGGLAGRGQDLNDAVAAAPEMLDDLGTVSAALAQDDGEDLTRLLDAAEILSVNLADRETEIASVMRDGAATFDALAADDGKPLERAIATTPDGLTSLRRSMDTLRQPLTETRRAAVALRPGAVALGRATPDLRGTLREAVPPLRDVPAMADSAMPAVNSLTPALKEARPVVAQLGTALNSAVNPLGYLSRYRQDVMKFFTRAQDALHMHDKYGGWLRIYVLVNQEALTGNVPIRSPLTNRDAYPAPGTSDNHRTSR